MSSLLYSNEEHPSLPHRYVEISSYTYFGYMPLPMNDLAMLSGAEPRAAAGATDMESSLGTCEICDRIVAFAGAPAQENTEVTIGKLEELLRGKCAHTALFKKLKRAWKYSPYPFTPLIKEHLAADCGVKAGKDAYDRYFRPYHPLREGQDQSRCQTSWELVHKENIPGHVGTCMSIDEQWIDCDLLRRRIAYCDTHHGESCRRSALFRQEDTARPKYLVDTHCACPINAKATNLDYVALSYQWGQTHYLRNNTQLCESLLVMGSLAREELASRIARTCRDAMEVVKLLGYRYLWVDSLCIIQDDDEQLQSELTQMHRIYNNATFTIVAVDGQDADYGLRGFEHVTRPRSFKRTYAQLSNSETLYTHLDKNQHSIDDKVPTNYYTRAWTFQEYMMSNRAIYFESGGVKWCCKGGDQTESSLLPHYNRRHYDFRSDSKLKPTMRCLGQTILKYSSLELSFPEDAFSAFVGVQSLLDRSHQAKLLYGLPEFWFDIALNWRPTLSRNFGITRREPSRQYRSRPHPYQLPSWSWIGWAGEIRFPMDHGTDVIPFGYEFCFTEPVTIWYTMSKPSSTDRRPINSGWHPYRLSARNPSATLPAGWKVCWAKDGFSSLKPLNSDTIHRPDDRPDQDYYFVHEKYPDYNYWYPFPIPGLKENDQDPPSLQTAYLFARTSRAYLSGRTRPFTRAGVWLESPDGKVIGNLHLNNGKELETCASSGSLRSMELVATCKGYFKYRSIVGADWNALSNQKLRSNSDSSETYQPCYFVLWIEWVDGVAYRKASGEVAAEVWEQVKEKDLVDLILG